MSVLDESNRSELIYRIPRYCLVGSVLNYAAEVWGFHKGPDVERLHTRFCRSLLGVKKSTNLSALYSELGRKPFLDFRKIRLLKYWVKILNTDNILLKNVYYMLVDDVIAGNNYNGQNIIGPTSDLWVSFVVEYIYILL